MKLKTEAVNLKPSAEHHFYAWCVFGWCTSSSAYGAVARLVKAFKQDISQDFKQEDCDFWLIKIHLPLKVIYDISHFEPVVDKALKEYVLEANFTESDEVLEALRT